jgi:hypothetical protein
MSADLPVVWHSISGIAKTAFIYYSPCPPWPYQYPSFRVLVTRDNGRSPLRVVLPQNSLPSI